MKDQNQIRKSDASSNSSLKELSEKAFYAIETRRRRPWQGEEEVRMAWGNALELCIDVPLEAERRQKDLSHNHVIVEFKAPGSFKASPKSAKFREAMEKRLLPYIQNEALRNNESTNRYTGIAIDGEHICFAKVHNGRIEPQNLLPFSRESVGMVLHAFLLDRRKPLTSENLLGDFAYHSSAACQVMQTLADYLAKVLGSKSNSKTKMLFCEWKSLYGQVADMSTDAVSSADKAIPIEWKGQADMCLPGKLFVVHTYNAFFLKLLSAEIVASVGLTSWKDLTSCIASCNDEKFISVLFENIETGLIFRQNNIYSFSENTLFGWFVDAAKEPEFKTGMIDALKWLLLCLSLYDISEETDCRDILRELYQGIVPPQLRKSLGEFYTPDWLVDYVLEEMGDDELLHKRCLDPTCGSGAFLVALIRRKKKEAAYAGISARDTLKTILTTVWGFDLSPLAVQTARTNYLLEIADLLRQAPGEAIEIPVLLADAVYSPSSFFSQESGIVEYRIGSKDAMLELYVPALLAENRKQLDEVFDLLDAGIEAEEDFSTVYRRLVRSNVISETEAELWEQSLSQTYTQVLKLHQKQWNGIWFRIVKNFFWSNAAGRFDYIVGNPPWVRWSKLPELYRERGKPTCTSYDIFSPNKMHGGNELDVSAIITYTTADKWLARDGKIHFLLTGTLFKNPSSEGFRRFSLHSQYNENCYLSPLKVVDMKHIKPFAQASNHTVLVSLAKGVEQPKYPVPYHVLTSRDGSRAIPEKLPLNEVKARLETQRMEASPVAGGGSPWAVLRPGRFTLLEKLSGVSLCYEGHKGITTDLNSVYFVSIDDANDRMVRISSHPEFGKKDVGKSRFAWVERECLYPLVKGAGDFEPCYLPTVADLERLYTFVPNQGITSEAYREAELRMSSTTMRQTREWFHSYREILERRSTYRRQMKGAPYFAIYNVGAYTFADWKVMWPEMTTKFYSAVAAPVDDSILGILPQIPDHKIYYVSFEREAPAYFLCGLLNAPSVREWIESHNISIQIGDIFKHTRLPAYDESNASHVHLSELVKLAHLEHDFETRSSLVKSIEVLADSIIDSWQP